MAGDGPETEALLLTGKVLAVSSPGGVWRHEIAIGERHFLVDDAVCQPPGARVAVRLPARHLFLFPADANGAAGSGRGGVSRNQA